MFFTIFLNGALGLASYIALLFSIGDIDAALATPTGWPFIEIFYNATRSKAGTTAMTSVLIVLIICATFGYIASASRQMWAFARDRGTPFHNHLAKVRYFLLMPVGLQNILMNPRLTTNSRFHSTLSASQHSSMHFWV